MSYIFLIFWIFGVSGISRTSENSRNQKLEIWNHKSESRNHELCYDFWFDIFWLCRIFGISRIAKSEIRNCKSEISFWFLISEFLDFQDFRDVLQCLGFPGFLGFPEIIDQKSESEKQEIIVWFLISDFPDFISGKLESINNLIISDFWFMIFWISRIFVISRIAKSEIGNQKSEIIFWQLISDFWCPVFMGLLGFGDFWKFRKSEIRKLKLEIRT